MPPPSRPTPSREAHEVAGAIEDQDWPALKDELGDFLFQVVFHARMAEERGLFDFGDVVAAITDKMVRRHPHVFAARTGIDSAEKQTLAWEERPGKRNAQRWARACWTAFPAPCPHCCVR